MRYDLITDSMTWSYSRLAAFEQCRYMWFLRYIYGVRGRSRFFSQYGSLMHRILQQYLAGELPPDRCTARYLVSYRREVTAPPPSSRIAERYFRDGLEFCKTLPIPKRKTVATEQELSFTYADHPFTAFVDWISTDDAGALCITDHKSRALKPRSSRKTPTASDRELDRYLRQLYVYAAGVRAAMGRFPDFLEFNCFRSGVWIREPFDEQKYRKTEEWARDTIEQISRTDQWIASEDFWFCTQLCDVWEDCEYQD